jgi:membrane-bound lytic murein transglycosylase B
MRRSNTRCFRTLASSLLFGLHVTLASGTATAVEPKGAMKPKEVKALVANATTPADHMKLARHFSAMAAKHDAEAVEHEALVNEYTRRPTVSSVKRPMAPDTAEHCKYFAEHCRNAAKEMRAMAAAHEAMAKEAEK